MFYFKICHMFTSLFWFFIFIFLLYIVAIIASYFSPLKGSIANLMPLMGYSFIIIFISIFLFLKGLDVSLLTCDGFLLVLRFFTYSGFFVVNMLRYEFSNTVSRLIVKKIISNIEITAIFFFYIIFFVLYMNSQLQGWFFLSCNLEVIGLNITISISLLFMLLLLCVGLVLLQLDFIESIFIVLVFFCFFFFIYNNLYISCNAMEVDNPNVDNPIVPPIKIPSNLGSPSDPYNLRIIIKHGQILMVERGISTKTLPKVVIPDFLNIKPIVKEHRFAWCHYRVVVPDTCKSLFDYIMAPIRCDLLKKHANWGGRDVLVTSSEHQLPYIYQICIMIWLPLYFGIRELFINVLIFCNVPGIAEIHYGYRFSRVFAHAYYSNDPNDCLGTGYIKNYDWAVILLLGCRFLSLLVTYFLGVGFMGLCSDFVNFSRIFGGLLGICCFPLTLCSYYFGDFFVNLFLWILKVLVSIMTKGF